VGVAELWVQDDDVDMAFEPNPACPPHANEWVLCLGHNPDLMQKIRHRADLFVFGHTHAGQIYLPFAPGLAVPIRSKLYRGMHLLRQGMVYISSGCGEASTPTRLGTLPEVVVITADTMST
jgi:predicted MPP superfamily phosphohydrolase